MGTLEVKPEEGDLGAGGKGTNMRRDQCRVEEGKERGKVKMTARQGLAVKHARRPKPNGRRDEEILWGKDQRGEGYAD